MCSAPLTVSGGVSMEKTASLGSLEPRAVESNLYYARLFPPARPRVLDALKRRLERHRAGLRAGREGRRGSGAGIGTHGGQGSAWPCPAATRIPGSGPVASRRTGKRARGKRERIMGAWADPVPAPGKSCAVGQRALSDSPSASLAAVTNWAWTCANRVTSGPGPPLGRGVRAARPGTRPGGLPAAARRAQPGTENHKTAASASQSAMKPADAGILGGCCGRRADGWSAGTVN
jgi:hypothetical protein